MGDIYTGYLHQFRRGREHLAEHQQARAELLPEVADRIVGIAADPEDAVRYLNACVDKYNAW